MNGQPKRIYQNLGNGLCVPVERATLNGGVIPFPIKDSRPVQTAIAQARGHLVMSPNELQAIAPEVVKTENSAGILTTTRAETGGVKAGNGLPNHTHAITLTNASAVVTSTAVIGDGMGLVARYLSIPALPAEVTVGGTFDTDTLTVIKTMAQQAALDYHGMHVECGASGYYAGGAIQTAEASLDNNGVKKETVNLGMLSSDATNSPEIRQNMGFRLGLWPNWALLVKVPPSSTVSIILGLEGAGIAGLIKKLSA